MFPLNKTNNKTAQRLLLSMDPGVSFGDVKGAFSKQYEQLEDLQSQEVEATPDAIKQQQMDRSTESARKLIAAQNKQLQDPSAVGTPDRQSIQRTQAIVGEGSDALASAAAQTAAEIERLSEDKELAETQVKNQQIQQLLSNMAAFREMKASRMDSIFSTLGIAAGSLLSDIDLPTGS
tara:strand:- start:390 stop:923 length:534 start_codon:yes stop_codon:yes gene_type:complete